MNTVLEEALEFEGKESVNSVKEMMEAMLQNVEDGGDHVRDEIDEFTIRKMLLARHYILKDIEKMGNMKKAITAEWDKRIASKKSDVQSIESMVDYFVRDKNKGKSLPLDVATSSLRRVNHKVKVKDEEKVKEHLKDKNMLQDFLKEPDLDNTKIEKHYHKIFDDHVEKLVDEQVEVEKEENNGKITKKRIKEIKLEIIDQELPEFNKHLPEGFELSMPEYRLTIRSNI